jgi:hypothetical protein
MGQEQWSIAELVLTTIHFVDVYLLWIELQLAIFILQDLKCSLPAARPAGQSLLRGVSVVFNAGTKIMRTVRQVGVLKPRTRRAVPIGVVSNLRVPTFHSNNARTESKKNCV